MSAKLATRGETYGFRQVLGYLGMFMILIGIITAIPMLVVIFYPSEAPALLLFGFVSLSNIIVGLMLYFTMIFRKKRSRLVRHEEFMLLVLTWLFAILAGALPFFISYLMGETNMTFPRAVFESTSGFSTTGLTTFEDFIDVPNAFCPHVFTFHRAFTNFIGGMGLVLLVASVLGTAGGGVALYQSEGHSDRLLPNIAKSAKLIFGIYMLYTVLATFCLVLAGMPTFDAICHAMSCLSGGGFSPRADNVGAYRQLEGQVLEGGYFPVNSLAIEIIVMVFVIFSAISFMLHTFLLRGKFRQFFRDDEIRYMCLSEVVFLVIALFAALIATRGMHAGGFFQDTGELLRMTAFYTIGSFTNSGFATTTSDASVFAYHIIEGGPGSAVYVGHAFTAILIVMMLIGGGAGSTAGGIKQYRIAVSLRSLYYALKYRFASIHQHYPRLTYRYGEKRELEQETIDEAHHYIFLYVGLFLILTLALVCIDPRRYTIESSAFDVASAMSNTGLSWVIGPSYVASESISSVFTLWILSLGMFLGRLEVLPAVYAISNIREEIRYKNQLRRRARREASSMLDEGE